MEYRVQANIMALLYVVNAAILVFQLFRRECEDTPGKILVVAAVVFPSIFAFMWGYYVHGMEFAVTHERLLRTLVDGLRPRNTENTPLIV
jgi:hypothetical protein